MLCEPWDATQRGQDALTLGRWREAPEGSYLPPRSPGSRRRKAATRLWRASIHPYSLGSKIHRPLRELGDLGGKTCPRRRRVFTVGKQLSTCNSSLFGGGGSTQSRRRGRQAHSLCLKFSSVECVGSASGSGATRLRNPANQDDVARRRLTWHNRLHSG